MQTNEQLPNDKIILAKVAYVKKASRTTKCIGNMTTNQARYASWQMLISGLSSMPSVARRSAPPKLANSHKGNRVNVIRQPSLPTDTKEEGHSIGLASRIRIGTTGIDAMPTDVVVVFTVVTVPTVVTVVVGMASHPPSRDVIKMNNITCDDSF
jgi:hypothetical protein